MSPGAGGHGTSAACKVRDSFLLETCFAWRLNRGFISAAFKRITVLQSQHLVLLLAQTFDFESGGNLKGCSLTNTSGGTTPSNPVETAILTHDTLDRLIQTNGTSIADTGANTVDLAGNLSSTAGLLLGYQSGSNRWRAVVASTCNAGTGNSSYDGSGNIQSYTRPTEAQSNNAPGADGAFLQLSGYTAFNLPTSITKSLGGTIQTSAEFFYDAGYQRTRRIKRSGPTQTGTFVDNILYVVPGGFKVHRNATGQIIKSIATLSGGDGVVATVTTNFAAITGTPLTQPAAAQNGFDVSSNNSGVNTVTKLILKDHLGSMVAEITLGGTPQAPTVAVNLLSTHGFGPWGNARNQTAALGEGQRGFTGHEHLAELVIIHMNGRLYDPVIGRFLQADPTIQAPHNAQSHNRYSYVLNNPLSFTDPSGFSAWTWFRAPILAIAAAAFMQYYLMPAILGSIGSLGGVTLATVSNGVASLTNAGSFVSSVASRFAAGGIQGGNIQSAVQGAFFAGLTYGLSTGLELHDSAIVNGTLNFEKLSGQVALHAAVGCGQGAAAGGSCKAGAVSGGISAFAGPMLPGDGKSFDLGRLVAGAVVGAIASKLSGGKAENGAITAAFGYLFNQAGAAATAARTVVAITTTCGPCGGKQSTPLDYEMGVPPQVAMGPRLAEFGGLGIVIEVAKILVFPIAAADRLAGIILSSSSNDAGDIVDKLPSGLKGIDQTS